MKTLEQIKNDYATNLGYISWRIMLAHLVKSKQPISLNLHIDTVMKIYAMECLKLASESEFTFSKRESLDSDWIVYVKKESITNEKNIIK